jgi:hypothetical protein
MNKIEIERAKDLKRMAEKLLIQKIGCVAESQSYLWAFTIKHKIVKREIVKVQDLEPFMFARITAKVVGSFEFLDNKRGDFDFEVVGDLETLDKDSLHVEFIDPFSDEPTEDCDFYADFWFYAYLGYIATH